jgi:cobyrinic acid a,c-diamide synthase
MRARGRVRGLQVRARFLDPHWHQLASGAPVHQLDLWMTGETDCAQRLHAAAQEADLILIEGVMGLFDGDPSAADLAQHFGVPVLAVVDASAMAGTFGALAFGLRTTAPACPGRVCWPTAWAAQRHADMLQGGLRDADDWMGALMRVSLAMPLPWANRCAALLPERHLGLVARTNWPTAWSGWTPPPTHWLPRPWAR